MSITTIYPKGTAKEIAMQFLKEGRRIENIHHFEMDMYFMSLDYDQKKSIIEVPYNDNEGDLWYYCVYEI